MYVNYITWSIVGLITTCGAPGQLIDYQIHVFGCTEVTSTHPPSDRLISQPFNVTCSACNIEKLGDKAAIHPFSSRGIKKDDRGCQIHRYLQLLCIPSGLWSNTEETYGYLELLDVHVHVLDAFPKF